MTITEDTTEVTGETDTDGADEVETESTAKRGRKRDFTKAGKHYEELAEFINANSDWQSASLGTISPLQVQAVLALKTDFANLPEKKQEREAKKREKAEQEKLYAGLSDEDKKLAKAADRAEKQAAELRARAAAVLAKASGSGEDLAAVVESNADSAAESGKGKRGLRR